MRNWLMIILCLSLAGCAGGGGYYDSEQHDWGGAAERGGQVGGAGSCVLVEVGGQAQHL